MAGRSRALRFKLLAAFILFAVVSWSVLWFVIATIVDRQVDRAVHSANANGAVIDCENRTVTGFPFRIELRCDDGSHAVTTGMDARIGGLVVAALIYNPAQLIAEMRGPVALAASGAPPLKADWDLAHASARIDLSARSLTRLDAELVSGEFVVGAATISLAEADLNLRRDPVDPASLNFHVRLDNLESAALDAPATLSAQGTVTGGAGLLAGEGDRVLSAILFAGAPVVLDSVTLLHGEMALAANGTISLDQNGFLSGTLNLALAGEDVAAGYLDAFAPGKTDTISTILKNLFKNTPVTTEVAGHAAKELSIQFDAGKVRVGAFPFPLPFQIPPLRMVAN